MLFPSMSGYGRGFKTGDEITFTHGPSGQIKVQVNDDAPVTAPFTVAEPLFPAVSLGDNM